MWKNMAQPGKATMTRKCWAEKMRFVCRTKARKQTHPQNTSNLLLLLAKKLRTNHSVTNPSVIAPLFSYAFKRPKFQYSIAGLMSSMFWGVAQCQWKLCYKTLRTHPRNSKTSTTTWREFAPEYSRRQVLYSRHICTVSTDECIFYILKALENPRSSFIKAVSSICTNATTRTKSNKFTWRLHF
jgi:hypothetical protein